MVIKKPIKKSVKKTKNIEEIKLDDIPDIVLPSTPLFDSELKKKEEEIEQKKEKIEPNKIHATRTIIIRENGEIRYGTETDLKWKNDWYQIESKEMRLLLIDYDQTKIRPYIKDILNRQSTFLEIKLLKWIIFILVIIYMLVTGMGVYQILKGARASGVDMVKNWIEDIKKMNIENAKKLDEIAKKPLIQEIPASEIIPPGFSTIPNNKKNLPSNP